MAQQDEANVINGTLAVSKHQLSFARHRTQLLNAIVFCTAFHASLLLDLRDMQ